MKEYPKRPDENMCECGHDIWHHHAFFILIGMIARKKSCEVCMCPKFESIVKKEKAIMKDSLTAIEVLGRIEIYVRMLQDGDPENENPKEILDYIEKEIQPMLKVIYNE